jgi:hypothetical protein
MRFLFSLFLEQRLGGAVNLFSGGSKKLGDLASKTHRFPVIPEAA